MRYCISYGGRGAGRTFAALTSKQLYEMIEQYPRRQPGMLVETKEGRIGRTYSKEAPINGKMRVHLFPASVKRASNLAMTMVAAKKAATAVDAEPPENLLCSPEALKILAYID